MRTPWWWGYRQDQLSPLPLLGSIDVQVFEDADLVPIMVLASEQEELGFGRVCGE
jgi:hypothetical protein